MKKIFAFCFLFSVLMLSSCQKALPTVTDTDNNQSDGISTVILGETEDISIFRSKEITLEKFSKKVLQSTNVKKTINVDILGSEYKGVYLETVKLPRSDIVVNAYSLEGINNSSVFVDSKSDEIIEYVNIPFDGGVKSENDYIDFIKNMLNENTVLSKYDYSCETHYYIFGENRIESTVDNCFRICGENERLVSYTFYFEKYVDGVRFPEHVAASFYEDTFSMEIIKSYHDENDYKSILENIDKIEENIEQHLKENVKEDFEISDIKHIKKSVFIMEDIPYVMTNSIVSYTSTYDDITLEIMVKTISCL